MAYRYLLDLAMILLSTKLLGMLTKRIQMPQVVGSLLAGLILGPAVLNVLTETAFLTQLSELGVIVLMFSAGMGTDVQELKNSGKAGFLVAVLGVLVPLAFLTQLSELGVIVLMFSAGMGTDVQELKNSGKAGFLVAVLGVLVPLIMGTGLAWAAGRVGMITTTGFLEDVFIGTILTATSVSITVETLKELGRLDTKVGNTILAAALIDDVLGLIALTIVSSVAGGKESIWVVLAKIALFFVFAAVTAVAANRFFCWMIRVEHERNRRRFPVLAFVLCLVMAYCAEEFFGVADITGAYGA